MPAMSQEAYDALIARIEQAEAKSKELEDKVADLSNLTKASLTHKPTSDNTEVDNEKRKEYLQDKLKRSLQ